MIIPGSPPSFPQNYVAPSTPEPPRHTKLAITAASAAGFFVTGYTSTHDFTPVLFAGSLAECLGYMAQSLGPEKFHMQAQPEGQEEEFNRYKARFRSAGEPK